MRYRLYDGYAMTLSDEPSAGTETTMRATNQRDAAGQDIFECDIIEIGCVRGVVEWDESLRRFNLRVGAETKPLGDVTGCRVLGNAFEHGELV